MITAINGLQMQPRAVMSAMTQRINRGASEEASESPSARLAEAQRKSTENSNHSSLKQTYGPVGQRLDVRA